MVSRRRQRAVAAAMSVQTAGGRDREIRQALVAVLESRIGRPVALTADQESAMSDVRTDLAGRHPMLRLLQGDVGSGKTAVAAYALAVAAGAGVQGALLAPTDLLARQHAVTLGDLLAPLGIPVTLLTGSLSGPGATTALEVIADGRAAVVIGTHALFSERVRYARLGLVVVDEQHRFGVEQRGALEAKTTGGAAHVLLMTATPIPRTLGQVLYADLDVSDLRTVPAGRQSIDTRLRHPDSLDLLWKRVRDEAGKGRRTFVVVPRIDEAEGDQENADGAVAEHERLATLLAPLRVGLVHGRMKPTGTRRCDGEVPRRGDAGARRHDRGRGRRRRSGGHRDGHRGRGPVRTRPAASASRPSGSWTLSVLLRPCRRRSAARTRGSRCPGDIGRTRCDARAPEAPRGGADRPTGSSWPRPTSPCAARATSSAWSRAACRGCRLVEPSQDAKQRRLAGA